MMFLDRDSTVVHFVFSFVVSIFVWEENQTYEINTRREDEQELSRRLHPPLS